MKNLFKYTLGIALALVLGACESEEKVVDFVFDNTVNGAFLRVLENDQIIVNGDSSSTAGVSVEYAGQDDELLKNIEFSLSYSGVAGNIGPVILSTVTPDQMGRGQFNNLKTDFFYTLGSALSALGLSLDETTGGDKITLDMRVNLTDGRTYGPGDANGNIGAIGGWYSSPYSSPASFVCVLPSGEWKIDMVDTYGDGWQTTTGGGGPGLQMLTAAGTVFAEVGLCSDYGGSEYNCTADSSSGSVTVNVPAGTEVVAWYFPGDYYGEIEYTITAPSGIEAAVADGSIGILELAFDPCATN
jgi:hypothetical protein